MASEVETLSPEERAALVASLGQKLAGRVPFIVGASDADPARAAARAREGRDAGASAAMVMAPNALGSDIEKHIAFYSGVAEGAGIPIMLQNAPAPMGAGLGPAQVAAIAKAVPGVRYVKEETLPCGQQRHAHPGCRWRRHRRRVRRRGCAFRDGRAGARRGGLHAGA